MITFFTCPKAFTDEHTKIIQTNAIRSWIVLKPTPEILLLGNDEGVSDVANELGVDNIPNIRYNSRGIPMLDSIFDLACASSKNDLLCYINSDIILTQDFMDTIAAVSKLKKEFLLVSQRWDLEINHLVNFNSPESAKRIHRLREKSGILHPPTGVDIHVSSSTLFNLMDLPPFILGRGCYDNWLIWRARSLNIPVIDITPMIKILHQNHDYSHISADAKSWRGAQDNPDYMWNSYLGGGWLYRYNIRQASHSLSPNGLKYRFIHPFFELFFITGSLFFELGVGELLEKLPSFKRALKQILLKINL